MPTPRRVLLSLACLVLTACPKPGPPPTSAGLSTLSLAPPLALHPRR
ncbi:MAG TPA: hypothetical protein VGB85_25370 [Nannocystis sp.]